MSCHTAGAYLHADARGLFGVKSARLSPYRVMKRAKQTHHCLCADAVVVGVGRFRWHRVEDRWCQSDGHAESGQCAYGAQSSAEGSPQGGSKGRAEAGSKGRKATSATATNDRAWAAACSERACATAAVKRARRASEATGEGQNGRRVDQGSSVD